VFLEGAINSLADKAEGLVMSIVPDFLLSDGEAPQEADRAALDAEYMDVEGAAMALPPSVMAAPNVDQSKTETNINITTNVTAGSPEAVTAFNKEAINRANRGITRNFNSPLKQGH
jgi:hypothetical protein